MLISRGQPFDNDDVVTNTQEVLHGKKRFSIVMPVYGVENYLRNSIRSVLSQTIQDFELILVDDESPDNCPQICDEYASNHENVRVIHQKNLGLSGARNTGAKAAQGDFLYFIDSDDIMQPQTLSEFDYILSQYSDVNFIFSDFQRVSIGNEFKKIGWDHGYELLNKQCKIQEGFLLGHKHILAPGTLYNLTWYRANNLQFDNNPFGEDQSFIYKELLCVNKIAYLKKPLYNYLTRPNSIMTGSSYMKVAGAYPFFKEISAMYQASETASPIVKKYLLPRWCLSVCHACSKLCSFNDYTKFLEIVDGAILIPQLKGFPSLYVKFITSVFHLNRRAFYLINRLF